MRLEAKRAFVLADWMKSASRCERQEEFFALLRAEQTRVSELREAELNQIIQRDEDRLSHFQTLVWELRTVQLGECHVYPQMGKRAWAVGSVSEVAPLFKRLEPALSRIWRMKLFAACFTELPLIALQKSDKLSLNDGSHRAIAMYLAGIRDVQAFVGTRKKAYQSV